MEQKKYVPPLWLKLMQLGGIAIVILWTFFCIYHPGCFICQFLDLIRNPAP